MTRRPHIHSLSESFAVGALIAMLAVAAVVLAASRARAHEAPTGWKYPWSCCSNLDCRELEDGEISEPNDRRPTYRILPTGEEIAPGDRRIKDSPDGAFHWCAHQAGLDAGHTICLFVPPRGF